MKALSFIPVPLMLLFFASGTRAGSEFNPGYFWTIAGAMVGLCIFLLGINRIARNKK